MSSIRRHKVLLDTSAAGDGEWFRLDSRYEVDPIRPFQVDMTAGDTIELEGTTVDVRGANPATVIASIQSEDISVIETFTASGQGVLAGNWTYIRIAKTGTNGNAKVQGHI